MSEQTVKNRLKNLEKYTREKNGKKTKYPQFNFFDNDMFMELILKRDGKIPTVFVCTDSHWVKYIFVRIDKDEYAVTKIYSIDLKAITDNTERVKDVFNEAGVYDVTMGKDNRFDRAIYYPTEVWKKSGKVIPDIDIDELSDTEQKFIKKNYA